MTELIDKPLAPLCLLHDTFLVVLPDTSGKLVIVHCGPVLSFSPKPGDAY